MRVLIRAGWVIAGTGAPPVPDGALLVDADTIAAVVPFAQVGAGAASRTALRMPHSSPNSRMRPDGSCCSRTTARYVRR